ncbi:beta-mannosidase [Paenibacillus sp. DS2015]|uniref:beta-mannosidase n=1 Tax=Paenibacillus sp. DS2015 TaxID=3373917 RepID=UPI003D23EF7D
MKKLTLCGIWQLQDSSNTANLEVQVPGSVYNDLLQANLIEDPFYRDNEKNAKDIMRKEYRYSRNFEISEELYNNDCIELVCEGLDTLTTIMINDRVLADTHNMHRTYILNVKNYVHAGANEIAIIFHNSLDYIAKKQEEFHLWGVGTTVDGFPHIRKAHSSYGWDWGPQLPDAGIWRDIYIKAYNIGRIQDVYMTQHHTEGQVELSLRLNIEAWSHTPLNASVTINTPDGQELTIRNEVTAEQQTLNLTIDNPQLWWPNGYGKQPLYKVVVGLHAEGILIDQQEYTIGLRTIRVKQQPDAWGESFEFEINGTSIFAMGANYIPEDNLLPRATTAKTEVLIQDCIEANFNCIRIWGGGIYPSDDFYDLCDRYGLIVWQDFMFACAVYDMTDAFADNIKQEAIDNIRRLRHRASLGLWCGNNEIESAILDWGFPTTDKMKQDYIQQFEVLLKDVVAEYDPNTFYWSSSPSSTGSFDNPSDPNRGDVHYWDVWHGLKPFTEYRSFHFRFCSEFGFQSFPNMKTIESFTLPEDRNIFSYVMERHQKNDGANGKILYYLAQNFKYPKDFSSLVYTSQLLQAEAMKYGVEHWRRNRGRCMGSIYWQLNDCWPVASWSSIDYYGRWKALHYFAKRFYAPLLISACEEGKSVALHVSNETMHSFQGTVSWQLRSTTSDLNQEGTHITEVNQLSSASVIELDFSDVLTDDGMRSAYLSYQLEDSLGSIISDGVLLLSTAKHFMLNQVDIATEWCENDKEYELKVTANELAKYVELELTKLDGKWSDNYFDLYPGQSKTITLNKESLSKTTPFEALQASLTIRSAVDIADV